MHLNDELSPVTHPAVPRSDVPSRATWPRALRLLFGLACVSVVGGALQTWVWVSSDREYFSSRRVQGAYAAAALLLGSICVVAGLLNRRRLFGLAYLSACAIHIFAIGVFNYKIATQAGPDPISGQFRLWKQWDTGTWYFCWNWLCMISYAAVAYYLLRYEAYFWRRNRSVDRAGFSVAAQPLDSAPSGQ